MKRLWPLPVLLLLALPLLAQEGEEAPAGDAPTQDAAPQEDKPAPAGETPDADKQPAAEPNSNDNQPAQEGGEGEGTEEKSNQKPIKEEPLISVKVSPPVAEEGDEESVAPPVIKTKVVATATLIKANKKGKPSKSAKGVKLAKGKTAVNDVVKTKAPAVAAEPPPPPVPAVPLTPITPRNP